MITLVHLTSGLGAGFLTTASLAIIHPLSGVYYPIAILPNWLQLVSWCLPTAPVFEGMRRVVIDNVVPVNLMIYSITLNLIWTIVAVLIFLYLFNIARRDGLLVQVGE